MGYYTDFVLMANTTFKSIEEAIKDMPNSYLNDFDFYTSEENAIDGYLYGTWREYDEDMINLSLKIPDVLFTLWGFGQDRHDIWVLYAKNGKLCEHIGKIVYPNFDESMLS